MAASQDVDMMDVGSGAHLSDASLLERELNEKYPHRPRNHSRTLPFHDLFLTLFNPLNQNQKKPTGPAVARKKQGPHGPSNPNPHEVRQNIVEKFISRWRKEVGNDIHPAFRLILPDKDRDRAMYGLKEKTIAKLLIKILKINKDSEDGQALNNWKQPGQTTASRMAGDFAGRCYEVISKRPRREEVGDMTIAEVNEKLDRLSAAQKEHQQEPIFTEFYEKMNPDELLWLIRIILKQMKVGATEKTLFRIWHPDAESLFNISSNLRRVCWELYDPSIRLEGDDRGIALMQCFQPQLAQFQIQSMQKMVDKMGCTEDDDEFWIEEKLDGERMQLHMVTDDSVPGGKRFGFWSRKAKDYTYLYGNGLMDDNSALTRHLKNAFEDRVENIILDGEMVTWDPELDRMVEFGHLKTAAIAEQKNPFSKGPRPLYRVFDLLYINGTSLTNHVLRDRRKVLETVVRNVERRLEIHTYKKAHGVADIEPILREVIEDASEGLVLKNPRSPYRLNQRNDDWMKVKPEYMDGYGEDLDCIVIGGYYGSGRRGGGLSSFLCGLRVDENHVRKGADPRKCFSFFKVGGGFKAADYAEIRHVTEDKWHKWDPKSPPTQFIELGGGELQYERPDVWIRPDESVVVAVKAAQVTATDAFRTGYTLRFPRFKKLRTDRKWDSALTLAGFSALKGNVEKEQREKKFKIDDSRKRKGTVPRKKALTVAGTDAVVNTPYGGPASDVFAGLNFYVMSDQVKGKTKPELEQLIEVNGGKYYQTYDAAPDMICIGDKRTVQVASRMKHGDADIVRPSWLSDCVKQVDSDGARPKILLRLEPRHLFYTKDTSNDLINSNVDEYGDSFARDNDVKELKEILDSMPGKFENKFDMDELRAQLEQQHHDLGELKGWMFWGLLLYIDSPAESPQASEATALRMKLASNTARFAGARTTSDLSDTEVTHIVVENNSDRLRKLRKEISSRPRLPRIVTVEWIEESWKEQTLLDEERSKMEIKKLAMIGCGSMGGGMALLFAEKGVKVLLEDPNEDSVNQVLEAAKKDGLQDMLEKHQDYHDLCKSLDKPKVFVFSLPHGTVGDTVVDGLKPYLEKGDIIIDASNEHWENTQRRQGKLNTMGAFYVGMGVSGGYQAARRGPSMCPGGEDVALDLVMPLLEKVAAKDSKGKPCVGRAGMGGAGHYVKMIHNGIEHGMMSALAEAWQIMSLCLGMTYDEIGDELARWNGSPELKNTFLVDIGTQICKQKDSNGKHVLASVEDKVVQDIDGSEGTGIWSQSEAIRLHVPAPTLTTAHDLRIASAFRKDRKQIKATFDGHFPLEKWTGSPEERKIFLEDLRKAVYVTFLASFVQGINIIDQADQENRWMISFPDVIQIWRNGCIIRSDYIADMLEEIFTQKGEVDRDLLHHHRITQEITNSFVSLKKVVAKGVDTNSIIPSISATLEFLKFSTNTILPTQFYEAQLDYFGKHMFDLKSEPAGEPVTGKHHFEWKSA